SQSRRHAVHHGHGRVQDRQRGRGQARRRQQLHRQAVQRADAEIQDRDGVRGVALLPPQRGGRRTKSGGGGERQAKLRAVRRAQRQAQLEQTLLKEIREWKRKGGDVNRLAKNLAALIYRVAPTHTRI